MSRMRVMTAAVSSGSGKTVISCGILSFLKNRGVDVRSFKCGPDYIDPMFHRRVLGIPGGNLDTFFAGGDEIREMVARRSNEAVVIEGVMGIYDGIVGAGGTGSCYDVARVTSTPVVLIVSVKGMGQTMLSVVRGILADDTDCLIRGIVLNRISKGYYGTIKPLMEEMLDRVSRERGVRAELLGGIPDAGEIRLDSRHLGLLMPDEIDDIHRQIEAAERLVSENLDTGRLMAIMEEAADLSADGSAAPAKSDAEPDAKAYAEPGPVLAVARDEAFCFYYEENLRLLEDCGIAVREFSPLHDECLPDDACGLLLGGGYPELHADALSRNVSMIESIRRAIGGGMPSLAECGGFMYLLEAVEDRDGVMRPMAGVVPGRAVNTGRLGRFGYVTVSCPDEEQGSCPDAEQGSGGRSDAASDGSLLAGLSVKGHEFHYYDSDNNGADAAAVKPGSGRSWRCMHTGRDHLWGFPHLYYPSCPQLAARFRDAMINYGKMRHGNMRCGDSGCGSTEHRHG